MRKNIVLILLISSIHSFCQAPGIKWAKTYGGSGSDIPAGVEKVGNTGYMIVGHSDSKDGDKTNSLEGGWIVKTDLSGNIKWQKTIEQANLYTVQATKDGNYIVCGSTQEGHGGLDFLILKIDSFGTIKWKKIYGGNNVDEANKIFQTSDAGFIVGGYSNSFDGDVTSHHGDLDNSDYWILKLDSTGLLQWEKTYGGSGDDRAKSVQQTTDGGFIIAGFTDSFDGDVTGHISNGGNGANYSADYWIVKTDSTGNLQWQKDYGAKGDEYATDVHQTQDSGYIVVGTASVFSNDGDVTNPIGLSDIWVLKLNSSGKIQWQKCFGGTHQDDAFNIEIVPDGYIMIGSTNSNDVDVNNNHGLYDLWLSKIDKQGNIKWQECLGGSNYEFYSSFAKVTSTNSYLVCGFSYSNDGEVRGNHGHGDYWVVNLSQDIVLASNFEKFNIKEQSNNQLLLSWGIQNTINTGYFVIERSRDARNFIGLDTVTALNYLHTYSYLDNSPLLGTAFYKIKVLNKDGSFLYSNVLKVAVNKILINLFPNPAIDKLNISGLSSVKNYEIKLFNANGNLLIQRDIRYSSLFQVDVKNLATGTYYIKITSTSNDDATILKFIKQ